MYLSRSYQHRVHIVDHVCGSDYQEFPIPCTRSPGEYRECMWYRARYSFLSLFTSPPFSPFSLSISRTAKLHAARSWQNVSYEYESRECKHVDTFYLRVNVFPLLPFSLPPPSLSLSVSLPSFFLLLYPCVTSSLQDRCFRGSCKFESAKRTGAAWLPRFCSFISPLVKRIHTHIHVRASLDERERHTLTFIMY